MNLVRIAFLILVQQINCCFLNAEPEILHDVYEGINRLTDSSEYKTDDIAFLISSMNSLNAIDVTGMTETNMNSVIALKGRLIPVLLSRKILPIAKAGDLDAKYFVTFSSYVANFWQGVISLTPDFDPHLLTEPKFPVPPAGQEYFSGMDPSQIKDLNYRTLLIKYLSEIRRIESAKTKLNIISQYRILYPSAIKQTVDTWVKNGFIGKDQAAQIKTSIGTN